MLPPRGQTVILPLPSHFLSESKPFTHIQCEDSRSRLLHGGALSRSYENMDGRYRNGGGGIHSVHDLDVVCLQRRNNMCSVWIWKPLDLICTLSSHAGFSTDSAKRWTDIIFVFVSIFQSQYTVLMLSSSLPLYFFMQHELLLGGPDRAHIL